MNRTNARPRVRRRISMTSRPAAAAEVRRPRVGHPPRQVEDRLRRVVELGRQPHFVGLVGCRAASGCSRTSRRPSASPRSAPSSACDRAAARGRWPRRRSATRGGTCPCRETRRSTRTPGSSARIRNRSVVADLPGPPRERRGIGLSGCRRLRAVASAPARPRLP